MHTISSVLAIILIAGCSVATAAQAADDPLKPVRVYDPPTSSFASDEDALAKDVSGIACMPAQGEKRVCLVINDQDTFAQFAELTANGLTPGNPIRLLKKGPSGPSGSAP